MAGVGDALAVIAVAIVGLYLYGKGYFAQFGLGVTPAAGAGYTPSTTTTTTATTPSSSSSSGSSSSSHFDITQGQDVGHTTSGTVTVKPTGHTCHGIPCGPGTAADCAAYGCAGLAHAVGKYRAFYTRTILR